MPVKAVETIAGSEPHESHLVLRDGGNHITRQSVIHLVMDELRIDLR